MDKAKERWTAYLAKKGISNGDDSNVLYDLYCAGYSAGFVDGIAEATTRRTEITEEDKGRLNGEN